MRISGAGLAGPATAKYAWIVRNMRDWDMDRVHSYMEENNMTMGRVFTRWLRVSMHRWRAVPENVRLSYTEKAKSDRAYTLKGTIQLLVIKHA